MDPITTIPQLNMFQAINCKLQYEHSCDYRINPRPYSTLALIIEGKVKFVLSDETVDISKGDIIFIPQGSKYISFWTEGAVYISLHFSFEPYFSSFAPQNFKLQTVQGYEYNDMYDKFENIREKYEYGGLYIFDAIAGFLNLYKYIISHLLRSNGAITEKSVQNAINYLKNNGAANCTVGELAAMCYLSESRFFTLFKKVTGYSPMEYKNIIKIRMAITMMNNNPMSITEISEKSGFSSISYFRKIFKKVTGKCPREYKKSLYF